MKPPAYDTFCRGANFIRPVIDVEMVNMYVTANPNNIPTAKVMMPLRVTAMLLVYQRGITLTRSAQNRFDFVVGFINRRSVRKTINTPSASLVHAPGERFINIYQIMTKCCHHLWLNSFLSLQDSVIFLYFH